MVVVLSKFSPNQRSLVGSPSILGAVVSPLSTGYSLFSKREKSVRQLAKAKTAEKQLSRRDELVGVDVIASISGYEDEELERFVIF